MVRPDARGGDLPRPVALAALGGLIVVAAALRMHALGSGLWFDEILTRAHYAGLPFERIVTTYDSRNHHMLYSVLAGASTAAFGPTAWALRLPAAVFGIASVAALYGLGSRVATRTEALLAAGLATVSYHHVWFSQNARGYTMLLFWTLVATGLFLAILRGTSRPRALVALYAIAVALTAYTHLTGILVGVAHGIVWAGTAWSDARAPDRSVRWTPAVAVALAGGLTLLLYAPVLPSLFHVAARFEPAKETIGERTSWTSPAWMAAETIRGLARGVPGGYLGLFAGASVGVAGLVGYGRRDPVVLALFVLPALLTLAVVLAVGHYLWPRLLFFSAGFALLILVRGVFELARLSRLPHATAAATVLIVAAGLVSATRVPAAWGPKQDYEGAAAFVQRHRAERDAVVTLSMTDLPYRDRPGWTPLTADDPGALRAIEASHDRTWVLYTFPDRMRAVQPRVAERVLGDYCEVAAFPGTLAGGRIVVGARPCPP